MAKKKKTVPTDKAIDMIGASLKKIGIDIRQDIAFLEPEYYVSTGSLALDNILGDNNGLPPGIIEIFGAEGVGKSTMALEIVAQAQQCGLTCYYFDVEKKMTASTIKTIQGLDHSKIKFPNINHGNDVIHALDVILPQDPKSVIVIDSVPAMISSAQFKEASDKDFYASIARLLNDFLPKARTWVRQNQTLLIFLNQIRDNINSYGMGPKTRTPGGRALKFNTDIRIELKKIGKITKGDDVIGQKLKAITHKNNMTRPNQTVEMSLIYGRGIDKTYELQELGLQLGIIEKNGAWFTYDGQRVQGSAKLVVMLDENPEMKEKLRKEVLEYL